MIIQQLKKNEKKLSQEYDNIYSIVGWHPTEAGSYNKEVESYLQKELDKAKVVALGEIGLDYHWMEDPKDVQEKKYFVVKLRLRVKWVCHLVYTTEKPWKIPTEF